MDKETLSKYGWVVIVIIVLVILMSFAAPFGNYFSNSTMAILDSLTNAMAGEAGFVDADKIFSEHFGSINNSDSSATTSYTLEEIEADEHLYAIGKTQPEYVVAEFNDDYTEVIITKNGDESDGLMADYDYYVLNEGYRIEDYPDANFSPMEYAWETLHTIEIKDGVKSVGVAAFCGCAYVKNITLPDSIELIDMAAFASCNCVNTEPIDLTLPLSLKDIGVAAFMYTRFGSVVIPEGVTELKAETFHCAKIGSITIPRSVVSIDSTILSSDGTVTKTIYGYAGSYAETYFNNKPYGPTFVVINENPELPEEPNPFEAAEQWINETGMDDTVKYISETYGTSYYASLLLALTADDEAIFAEALPLAQQSDDAIEEYLNTNMGFDINNYFKENIGATAHQIAYYIEKGNWPA